MEEFKAYVEANAERFIEELTEFCRQPSIAAQGIELEEMGQLGRAKLEKLGAEVCLMPVDNGPPVIYAELGQGQRTLLLYNHYDVHPPRPAGPLGLGTFRPPDTRGETLRPGRGRQQGRPVGPLAGHRGLPGQSGRVDPSLRRWLDLESRRTHPLPRRPRNI